MKKHNLLLTIMLILAFLAESTGVGMFIQHPMWCWALRPMSERVSKKQRLYYLTQFKNSPIPVINPSLTTLVDLLKAGRQDEFLEKAKLAQEIGAGSIHLDIFDPNYVGTDNMKIFTPELMSELDKVLTIPKDAHLMVRPSALGGIDKFKDYIRSFIEHGARFVTIHWGAFIIDGYGEKEIKDVLKFIRQNGACAGLAVNPDEDAKELLRYKDDFDFPLVMSVIPGAGGRGFDDRALKNIEILENAGLGKIIAVDGGIKDTTVEGAFNRGGKWFVVGSYYFGSGDNLKSKAEMQKAHESLIKVREFPAPSKIKAVFFDIGNVLIFWDSNLSIVINELAKHCDMNEDKIYKILRSPEDIIPYDSGTISAVDFFQRIKKKLNLRETIDYETFSKLYSQKNFRPNPVAVAAMKQLKKDGYKIFLLTEVDEIDWKYWRNNFPEIFEVADDFIVSHIEKASKRDKDKRLFKIALERAGINPDEALYIDDMEEYLKSFASLGVKAVIQYTPGMNLHSVLNNLLKASTVPADTKTHTGTLDLTIKTAALISQAA